MAVQTFTILNKANHGPSTYVFLPVAMPANVQSARIYIDSTQGGTIQYSNPATHINIFWATSTDGGVTYVEDGATTDGGYINRQGQPQDPEITINFSQRPGDPLPDHAQGRVVVSGGTVRFGVFADVVTG